MTRNNSIKSLSLATAALALGVAGGSAQASQLNLFGMTELGQGYSVATNEAKCGEGKCGGSKPKAAEGKCGEGKCGGSKPKAAEGKSDSSNKAREAEAKCGEGKCGGSR